MSHDEAVGAIRALLILIRQTGAKVDVHDQDPAWIAAAMALGGEHGAGRVSEWVELEGLTVYKARKEAAS